MATIQLDQEILDVERIIDEKNHDEAFRRLILLRDRFGRRPEYRYLKALFDVTFQSRSDRELLAEVRALVAEQPDFLEAVSLLALLLDRTGDRDRARVFAREAVHAHNTRARARAQAVLGDVPDKPAADEEPYSSRPGVAPPASEIPLEAPTKPNVRPVVMPTPNSGLASQTRSTKALFAVTANDMPPAPAPMMEPVGGEADLTLDGLAPPPSAPPIAAPAALPSSPADFPRDAPSDSLRLPSTPPVQDEVVERVDTLEGLPRPPAVPADEGQVGEPSVPPPTVDYRTPGEPSFDLAPEPSRDPLPLASEFIPFSPAQAAMPPPPTIPPGALNGEDPRRSPTQRGMRTPLPPQARSSPTPLAVPRSTTASSPKRLPTPLPPQYAIDNTGIGRPEGERRRSRPSRPAISIPEPAEQIRGWFQFARQNQLQAGDGFSTARTLLDLCERVVEGATPLSSHPVPLDRRGLILVEERLEAMRGSRTGTQPTTERGAVTAAAAFLLGLMLKECDGRASDTSAEDGACKVVVPSGATVRPLLVAAAFMRSRGPSLVETFDRAATAHMRRGPSRVTTANATTQPSQQRVAAPQVSGQSELTVLRRDLDGSTLGVTDPEAPPAPQPPIDMRRVAGTFWSGDLGREIIGTSRRVGTFTIADVDAIERYASKSFSAVGFAPPGSPWPWSPPEDLEDMILSWGAILGEVLVALYSGRWESDPGNPQDRHLFRVVVSGGVVAWPVAKAYMRLARGIPHDLSVYVDAVGRVVGRQALGARSWPKP